MAIAFPQSPGLYFIGQTEGWDTSFAFARDILQKSSRGFLGGEKHALVLLGPHLGEASQDWLLQQQLAEDKQLFGKVFLPWRDWVREQVRGSLHAEGQALRELAPVKARKLLRQILEALERAGKLPSVGALWREERFFRTILAEVSELREAGLDQEDELFRARELLQKEKEGEARLDLEELWYLLQLFSRSLEAEGVLDWAGILRNAVALPNQDPLFLLGFSFFSSLERELLQNLAKQVPVIVALSGEATLKHPLVKNLSLGYAGHLGLLGATEPAEFAGFPVLEAHTPTEEALACAAFLAVRPGQARLLLGRAEEKAWPYFAKAYGNARLKGLAPSPEAVLKKFLSALALPEQNFALDALSDYASFLASFKDPALSACSALLARHGFRKGLASLLSLAALDASLQKIAAECRLLQVFPAKATGRHFETALWEFLKESGWSESARLAAAEGQRFFHGALAALTKAAAQVAAEHEEALAYSEWLAELNFLCESYQAEPRGDTQAELSLFKHGEWLPPAAADACTVFLGLDHNANPSPARKFYLDERTRLRLQDWGLESQQGLDEEWLAYLQTLGRSQGFVLASWAKHSESGDEQSQAWALDLYGWKPKPWPEAPWPFACLDAPEERAFQVPPPVLPSVSVTLLNAWGDCPFRAWAEHVVRLSDAWLESDLDLPVMDQGSVFHRTVELYFSRFSGRNLVDDAGIEQALREAAALAFADQSWRYYKGGQSLLEVHREQLVRSILGLLKQQRDYFAQFPDLGDPLCEQEFSLLLPGAKLPLKGKIDRIDRSRDGGRLLVVDYKTGSSAPESKEVAENINLQLQLYLSHASREHKAEPIAGYFLLLKNPDKKSGIFREEFRVKKGRTDVYFKVGTANLGLLPEGRWQEVLAGAELEAVRRLEKISAGEFPVEPRKDDLCERCAIRPVCRVHAEAPPLLLAPAAVDYQKWEAELRASRPKSLQKESKAPTDEQAAAIAARGKLVFVEASAGTGKTTVLVERIAQEIRELAQRLPVEESFERILAISFTDKSTQELSERLTKRLLPDYGPLLAAQAGHRVSTIHGFCAKVILDFPALAGVSPLVRSLNALEARELQEEVLEELFIAPAAEAKIILDGLYNTYSRRHLHKALLDLCGKRSLLEREKAWLWENDAQAVHALAQHFFALYDKKKAALSVLDFNDQERLCLAVLRQKSAYYRGRFSLVLVDEFQDTNSVQREIVGLVAKDALSNLFVVGDAKQSIYRFRAADVAVFQGLRKEAAAKDALFSLSKNFRSQARIVDFVNEICGKEMPATGAAAAEYEAEFASALAFHPAGEAVQLLRVEDNKSAEAKALAQEIALQIKSGRSPGDIAVLLRKLSRNDAYGDELRALGIPFVQEGGEDYFSESVVLDGITLLRVLVTESANLSVAALLRSPWFRVAAADLSRFIEQSRSERVTLLKTLPADPRFAKISEWREELRFAPLSQVLRKAYESYPAMVHPRTRAQGLKLVAKIEDLETRSLGAYELVRTLSRWAGYELKSEGIKERLVPAGISNCVTLSTVHAAKGLEYPVSYVVDLDGRTAPDAGPIRYYPGIGMVCKDPQAEEDPELFTAASQENKAREAAESKRLLYVALTRAKEELRIIVQEREKEPNPNTWGTWLRRLEPSENFLQKKIIQQELAPFQPVTAATAVAAAASTKSKPRRFPLSTTVSELSAYRFCPEFHRRKFVVAWEDKVIDLFPTAFKRPRSTKKRQDEAALALKELGLQNKERGIALHRALERTQQGSSAEEWRLWLEEIYAAQGAAAGEALTRLVAADIELLENFLESSPGKLLFAKGAKHFSELPFILRLAGTPVIGAIDRVVRDSDGTWIVADYKSSLGEASQARYTLQLAVYMLALQRALVFAGEADARVKGLLIDLHGPEWLEIPSNVLPEQDLLQVLSQLEIAYTAEGTMNPQAGKHCALCPYLAHCDVGQKSVLQF